MSIASFNPMWRCDKGHITIMKIITNETEDRTYITAVGDEGIAVTGSYCNETDSQSHIDDVYNSVIQECENKNS